MEQDPTKTLLTEAKPGPQVGVGAWRSDDSIDEKGCKAVVDILSARLVGVWTEKADLNDPGYSLALWHEFQIPADGNVDAWSESVMQFFEKMATELTQTLTDVANSFKL